MVSIRRRKNQQASASTSAPVEEPPIPEGWRLADHENPNGDVVKCYTNVIGQKFFTMEALLRYVEFAKSEQISIYKPGFDPSQLAHTSSEDDWDSLDSILSEQDEEEEEEEEEKRDELEASTERSPAHSELKEQAAVAVPSTKRPSPSTQVSDHAVAIDKKLDECATSSEKGKDAKSNKLAGTGPEIIPEKAQ